MHCMQHSCSLPQTMICLLKKDTIIWKGWLVDMEACDLLIENLGKKATSNHKTEMGFLAHGAMQFEFWAS